MSTTLTIDVPAIATITQITGDTPEVFFVSGTVTDNAGSPVQRTLRLYNRLTGALLDSTLSDSVTGAFDFTGIAEAEFYIVAVATGAAEPDLIHRVTSGLQV